LIELDPSDPTPIYAQVERGFRAAMAIGRLQAGDQLPAVRQLAAALRLNPNTVARVYTTLEHAGLVERRRGIGTFVTGGSEPAWSAAERSTRLRTLATRLVSCTLASGFSMDEVVAEVEALIKEESDSLLNSE
jgi:GntR family transcriptional regulator